MKQLAFVISVFICLATVSAATIRIEPVSGPVPVGGTVNVNVSVSDVTDLYAYQFDLAFNATLLSASTITEGPYLRNRGNTFFIPGLIDNNAGTVTLTADTILGPPFINVAAPTGPLL